MDLEVCQSKRNRQFGNESGFGCYQRGIERRKIARKAGAEKSRTCCFWLDRRVWRGWKAREGGTHWVVWWPFQGAAQDYAPAILASFYRASEQGWPQIAITVHTVECALHLSSVNQKNFIFVSLPSVLWRWVKASNTTFTVLFFFCSWTLHGSFVSRCT